MNVSSRTPEGFPSRCPLCGESTNIEYSEPAGDATCPHCGCLLWHSAQILEELRPMLSERFGRPAEQIEPDALLADLGADSLDTVELVMELEEEFDIDIPDEVAENIRTVGDAIRYIEERRRRKGDAKGEPGEPRRDEPDGGEPDSPD